MKLSTLGFNANFLKFNGSRLAAWKAADHVDSRMSRRIIHADMKRATLLLLVALFAAAILFPGLVAGIHVPTSNEGVFGASDLLDVNLPLRAYAGRTLAGGRLPLWYPGCYGGVALGSVPEAAGFYPPSTLFYMAFGPVRATGWSLAIHLALAGAGLGLFAGRLGARGLGQAMAAICAAAGLWLPDHFRQMNLLQAAAWTPWALWALDRWIERPGRREGAALGLALGMAGLAGHLQMFHHTIVGLAVWAASRLGAKVASVRSSRKSLDWGAVGRGLGSLSVAAGIAIALSAPHLLPMVEAIGLASRAGVAEKPAHPAALATLIDPAIFGSPADGSLKPKWVYWEEAQYIGLIPLAFGLGWLVFGLGGKDRARRSAALAVAAIILASLILAYGGGVPGLGSALKLVPGYSLFRYPQRYLWLCSLALAAAGGLGLDSVLGWIGRATEQRRRLALGLAAAAILATITDLRLRVAPICPVGDGDALLAEPESAALLRAAGANPEAFAERVVSRGAWDHMRNVFEAAGAWSGPREPYLEQARLMSFQRPSLYGWQTARGYIGLPPHWAALAAEDQHDPGLLLALEWQKKTFPEKATPARWAMWAGTLGAKWVLSNEAIDDPILEPLGNVPGKTLTIYLYKNKAWLGPAWIARRALRGRTDPEIENWLFFEAKDFASQIVSTEPLQARVDPAGASAGDAIVSVESPRPERVDVKCKLASPAWVVVSLGFHPRWRATLEDGTPALVERVNLSQMAVLVPAGEHAITLEFDGWIEKLSLALAGIGLLGAAAAFRKRKIQAEASAGAAP